MPSNVEIPQVDPSIELEIRESFLGAVSKAAQGEMDTHSLNELPEGEWEGEIVSAECVSQRSREGDVAYPRFLIRVKTPEWTSTTGFNVQYPRYILALAVRLGVPIPQVDIPEEEIKLTDIVEYLNDLGEGMVGVPVKVRTRARKEESGVYMDMLLSRR